MGDSSKRLRFRDAFWRYVLDVPELKELADAACEIDEGSKLVFEGLHYPSETYVFNNGYAWPIRYNWKDHCSGRDGSDIVISGDTITDGLEGILGRRESPDVTPEVVLSAFEKLGELVTAFFQKFATEELSAYGRYPSEREHGPIPWDFWEPDDTYKSVDVKHGRLQVWEREQGWNVCFEGITVVAEQPSQEEKTAYELIYKELSKMPDVQEYFKKRGSIVEWNVEFHSKHPEFELSTITKECLNVRSALTPKED